MCDLYKYLKSVVFMIEPEIAHKIAMISIKNNCIFNKQIPDYFENYLSQEYFGINFKSPLGLAAGFDKNGELTGKIHLNGFGFTEVGTTTPLYQYGNEKPRVFRVIEEEGLINRLGFNNDGIDKLIQNVSKSENSRRIPVGINIGPNKSSKNFVNDYLLMIGKIYDNRQLFDYITINISSPNTSGLRDLQQIESLKELLEQINFKIDSFKIENPLPLFVKIAPDLDDNDVSDIVSLTMNQRVSGLIVSNTTIDKSYINSSLKSQSGGLSGKPLFDKSTKLLSEVYKIVDDKMLLIGVGGISSASDVITKMRAGASLVQLYTSMIYQGLFVVNKINRELVSILQRDGVKNIGDIVGKG